MHEVIGLIGVVEGTGVKPSVVRLGSVVASEMRRYGLTPGPGRVPDILGGVPVEIVDDYALVTWDERRTA